MVTSSTLLTALLLLDLLVSVLPSGLDIFRISSNKSCQVKYCVHYSLYEFSLAKCQNPETLKLADGKTEKIRQPFNSTGKSNYYIFNIQDTAGVSIQSVVVQSEHSLSKTRHIEVDKEGYLVNIIYEIKCDRFHYGDNCAAFCEEKSDDKNVYQCHEDGRRTCAPGWEGYNGKCDYNATHIEAIKRKEEIAQTTLISILGIFMGGSLLSFILACFGIYISKACPEYFIVDRNRWTTVSLDRFMTRPNVPSRHAQIARERAQKRAERARDFENRKDKYVVRYVADKEMPQFEPHSDDEKNKPNNSIFLWQQAEVHHHGG